MAAVLDEGSWFAGKGGLLKIGDYVDSLVVRCQDGLLGRDAFQRRKRQFGCGFAGFHLTGLQRNFFCGFILGFVFRSWQFLIKDFQIGRKLYCSDQLILVLLF